jgi:phosphate transport system substrate-binding protein
MENGPRRSSARRLSIIVLVGAGLCLLAYISPPLLIKYFVKAEEHPSLPHLQTGGTSVVAFLLDNRWKPVLRKTKGLEVDYESAGSTQGINKMISKDFAVGFTHARMTDEQRQAARSAGGDMVHIPVVICAVVPLYNVKELKDKPPVKFSGEVLADIFLGKIDTWNDSALKKLNPDLQLPDTKISVVHRADSSGTTFIFTDYLAGASEAWRKQMGPATNLVKWPVGTGASRNHGVADLVYRTEGAIGYTDLLYSQYGDMQYGAVQNKDKNAFIHAESENMTAAVHGLLADIPDDLTFKLTNTPGKGSYPICGAVWAVCYQNQPAAKQRHVVDFLNWVVHDGQQFAKDMTYAPLPGELVKRAEEKIKLIKTAS